MNTDTRSTYLLTWNPQKYSWDGLEDAIHEIEATGTYSGSWSTGKRKNVQIGDRLFLIRLGEEPKGIVASGKATSEVYEKEKTLYVDVDFDVILDPEKDQILPLSLLKSHPSPGTAISDEEANELENAWKNLLIQQNKLNAALPSDQGFLVNLLGIQKLFNNLVSQMKADFHKDFTELIRLKLLMGLQNPKVLRKIVERLHDNQEEKQCLAKYLVAMRGKELKNKKVFIESGTTLAYLAIEVANDGLELRVLTNSFLAQLALLGFVDIGITPGDLRMDYHSYLPFAPGRRFESTPITEDDRARDRFAFENLDHAMAESDVIFMTASNFGFLVGPLVGSRDNAIFKYCLLQNSGRRWIYLCISQPKVFCLPGFNWEGESDHSVKRSITKDCFTVFDLPKAPSTIEAMGNSVDANLLTEREDIFPEVKVGDGGFRSAPTELGLHNIGRYRENPPVQGTFGTWLDYLSSMGQHVRIVIGCKSPEQKEQVVKAKEHANKVIESLGDLGFQYEEVTSSNTAGIEHVVEFEIKR